MISQCPSCKKQIDVPESAIGKKVRCSGCQAVFVVEAPAPPNPAPPAKVEVLDNLEEIVEGPPPVKKQVKKPAPAAAPNGDNPFSFEGPSPLAGAGTVADPASSLDFSTDEPRLNVGVRLQVRRAANLMYYGVFICVLNSILMTIVALAISMGNPIAYVLANIPAAVVMAFGIVVLQGAKALSDLRSRGLCITAAIFCLLIALPGLASATIETFALVSAGPNCLRTPVACGVVVFSVYCLLGGIYALMVIFRADVAEAFHHAAESQRRADAQATYLTARSVRGYAVTSGLVLLLFAFWMTLSYGLGTATMLYSSIEGIHPLAWVVIGVAGFFYIIAVVPMMTGAGVTFALKAPFLAKVAGVTCIVVAFLSYFGVLYVMFLLVPLLAMSEQALPPQVRTVRILLGCDAAALCVQLVLGFMAYGSAMRTARLIGRFQKGSLEEPSA